MANTTNPATTFNAQAATPVAAPQMAAPQAAYGYQQPYGIPGVQAMPYNNNLAYAPAAGFMPAQQPAPIKPTVLLTPAQMAQLRSQASDSQFVINPIEFLADKCVHKDENGRMTIQMDPTDGSAYCTICHQKFDIVMDTEEELKPFIKKLDDLVQTTKLISKNFPAELLTQITDAHTVIRKTVIPAYILARSQWDAENRNVAAFTSNPYGNAMMGQFNAITNPGYAYNPYGAAQYVQPQMAPQMAPAYGYQQPMGMAPQAAYGYQQPAPFYNPAAAQMPAQAPVAGFGNPFGNAGMMPAPQAAYAPQAAAPAPATAPSTDSAVKC